MHAVTVMSYTVFSLSKIQLQINVAMFECLIEFFVNCRFIVCHNRELHCMLKWWMGVGIKPLCAVVLQFFAGEVHTPVSKCSGLQAGHLLVHS